MVDPISIITSTTAATTSTASDTTAISSARNNNLVAESDYNAAIGALQHKIKEKQQSLSKNNDDGITQQLYNDCSNSLCQQIQKIVQPISDEAYHMYLCRYNDNHVTCPSQQETMNTSNTTPPSTTTTSSSTRINVNDVVFADEELMDQVAMKRVHELRQQVRDKSKTILQLRQTTVQRALSITERQMALLLLSRNRYQQMNIRTSHRDKNSTTTTITTNAMMLEQHQSALQQMKESFMRLYDEVIVPSNSLGNSNIDTTTAAAMMQLQDEYQTTIQTIEQGLLQQQSTHGSSSSSHAFEQAILRRDYHHQQYYNNNNNNTNYCNDDNEVTMDAEQLLTNLLCR